MSYLALGVVEGFNNSENITIINDHEEQYKCSRKSAMHDEKRFVGRLFIEDHGKVRKQEEEDRELRKEGKYIAQSMIFIVGTLGELHTEAKEDIYNCHGKTEPAHDLQMSVGDDSFVFYIILRRKVVEAFLIFILAHFLFFLSAFFIILGTTLFITIPDIDIHTIFITIPDIDIHTIFIIIIGSVIVCGIFVGVIISCIIISCTSVSCIIVVVIVCILNITVEGDDDGGYNRNYDDTVNTKYN